MLHDARADILAFTGFPAKHWQQILSTNLMERVNKEIKRRTDRGGDFDPRTRGRKTKQLTRTLSRKLHRSAGRDRNFPWHDRGNPLSAVTGEVQIA